MFAHAEAARQKEYDHRICWGCQQPLLERDLQVELSTMELITQETTQEEIMALYHQVYQLKRNPREVPCSEDTKEEICLEILETLKEHLQCRQGSAQLERESRQRTSRMPAQAEFHTQVQAAYDCFSHHCDWQRVPGGGPAGSKGHSPPGTGHSSYAGRTQWVTEPLHLLWVAW